MIDGRRGTIYHLNPTGAAILAALLAGGIERAVATIIGQYGITETRARADVGVLIQDLRHRRLIIG